MTLADELAGIQNDLFQSLNWEGASRKDKDDMVRIAIGRLEKLIKKELTKAVPPG